MSVTQSTYPESSDDSTNNGSNDSPNTSQQYQEDNKTDKKPPIDGSKLAHQISISIPNVVAGQLPRIAEEKDSPTGNKDIVESSTSAPVTVAGEKVVNKIVKQIQDESLDNYDVQRRGDKAGSER